MDAFPLEDFVIIAADTLGVGDDQIMAVTKIGLAESALAAPYASYAGEAFYNDPVERAAILASRIVRNHPLPDGNKRTALLCMLVALDEAGYDLVASQDDRAEAVERLAGAQPPLSEQDFVAWVKANIEQAHEG